MMDQWLPNGDNSTHILPNNYTEIGSVVMDTDKQPHDEHTSTSSPITHHETSTSYMDNDKCIEIWNILKSWKLECVYQTCIDQCIDTEVLKYMNNKHIGLLMVNFPLGLRIKFEKYVNEYQQNKLGQLDVSFLEAKSIPLASTKNSGLPNSPLQNPSENLFDLGQILTKSTQGPLIVDFYYKHKHLNESSRTILVEIIINDLIKKNRTMTINLANDIANTIVVFFPSEIKDVYFLKDPSCKAPKGKIYSKYFNTMKKLQSVGLKVTNKTNTNNKIVCRSEDQLHCLLEIEPDSEYLLATLHDEDLSWPEVETVWKKTINFRLQYIKNNNTASIFKKWKHFTKPMGYKLVEIDFSHMYSNFKNLSVKFESKSSLLLSIFDERVKDNASKILLHQLKGSSNLCEDGKNLTILYLLHSLFIPVSKKVTRNENGKKSFIKYSIKDSQNTFIKEASTPLELEVIIEKLKNQESSIQPCILVVGSLLNPKQILVYFDDVKYKVFSALKAVDICFKLFHVFNLEYPFESSNVWLFLQVYFYEIHTKYDKSCSLVKQICSELDANSNI